MNCEAELDALSEFIRSCGWGIGRWTAFSTCDEGPEWSAYICLTHMEGNKEYHEMSAVYLSSDGVLKTDDGDDTYIFNENLSNPGCLDRLKEALRRRGYNEGRLS